MAIPMWCFTIFDLTDRWEREVNAASSHCLKCIFIVESMAYYNRFVSRDTIVFTSDSIPSLF